jgi:glycosyltransferase involved in cell wall biosynthesis
MDAVNRLKAEGFPLRLFFATNIPSRVVRYVQVQADIVIDQLNYGRMGANAREALMLGKPVIVKVDPRQTPPVGELNYIAEAPVVNANEDTVYHALKALIQHPERWPELGREARAFALKWHSSDACAERFEDIVDRVEAGLPPENPAVAAASGKRYWFEPPQPSAEAG